MKKALLLLFCCSLLSPSGEELVFHSSRHLNPYEKAKYQTVHPTKQTENPLYKLSVNYAYIVINDCVNGNEYHFSFCPSQREGLIDLIRKENDNIMPNLGIKIKEGKLYDFIVDTYISKVPAVDPEYDSFEEGPCAEIHVPDRDLDEDFFSQRDAKIFQRDAFSAEAQKDKVRSSSSSSSSSDDMVYIRRKGLHAVVPLSGRYCIGFENILNLSDGFYPKESFYRCRAFILDSTSYHSIEELGRKVAREVCDKGLDRLRDNIDMLDEIVDINTLKVLIVSHSSKRVAQEARKFLLILINKAKNNRQLKPIINKDIGVLLEILGEDHWIFTNIITYSPIWGCYTMREFLR